MDIDYQTIARTRTRETLLSLSTGNKKTRKATKKMFRIFKENPKRRSNFDSLASRLHTASSFSSTKRIVHFSFSTGSRVTHGAFVSWNSGTFACTTRRYRRSLFPFFSLSFPCSFSLLSFRLNKWTDVFGVVHSRQRAREPSTHTRSSACRCYTSECRLVRAKTLALRARGCFLWAEHQKRVRRGEDKPKRCQAPDYCTSWKEQSVVYVMSSLWVRREACLATASKSFSNVSLTPSGFSKILYTWHCDGRLASDAYILFIHLHIYSFFCVEIKLGFEKVWVIEFQRSAQW